MIQIKSSAKIPVTLMKKVDLVASLGITSRAFENWGVPPAAVCNRAYYYNIKDVVDNRVANSKGDHMTDGTDNITKAQADVLLVKEKIRSQRLKTDVEEGKFVPVEIIESVFALAASKIGAELDTFYMLIKRKYNNLPPEIISDIDGSARNCANALAGLEFDLERELKLDKDET